MPGAPRGRKGREGQRRGGKRPGYNCKADGRDPTGEQLVHYIVDIMYYNFFFKLNLFFEFVVSGFGHVPSWYLFCPYLMIVC